MFRCIRLLFVPLLMVCVAAPVFGQAAKTKPKKGVGGVPGAGGGGPPAGGGKVERVQGAGRFSDFQNGAILVLGAGGDKWLVSVDPKAKDVSFTGTADVSWVQPGMGVRFTTKLDKRGKALEPIGSLLVVTLREDYQPGVQSEAPAAEKGSSDLFTEPKNPKEKPVKKKKEPLAENQTYTVTGQLTSLKNGKFTVSAAGMTVSGELAEKLKISFDITDFQYLRQGDAIKFSGMAYEEQKSIVWANSLTVTAAEPLVGEAKPTKKGKPGDAKPDAPKSGAKPDGEEKPDGKEKTDKDQADK